MFDVNNLIATGGYLVIGLIIFGESGLMVGFFFPGDTLLLSAGVFAATGKLSLVAVILIACLAAIAGDNLGYHIGRLAGPRLFKKKDGLIFRQEYVEKSEKFFERWGPQSMLFAHFIPIVRTFLPVVAGVGKMPRLKFFIYDAIGDCAWAVSITLLGYYVGSKIPNLDKYVLILVAVAVFVSLAPVLYHAVTRSRKNLAKRNRSK